MIILKDLPLFWHYLIVMVFVGTVTEAMRKGME